MCVCTCVCVGWGGGECEASNWLTYILYCLPLSLTGIQPMLQSVRCLELNEVCNIIEGHSHSLCVPLSLQTVSA